MTEDRVFQTIVDNARTIVPRLAEHDFLRSDSLRDLGANSVDRSEIVMTTLEDLSLDIPLVAIARAENIGELAQLMCACEPA